VPVREHWDLGLRELGTMAARAALSDAHVERTDCVVVGNMLASRLSAQDNLGTLVAESVGLLPAEAWRIEAACGSGGAAMRAAVLAVASGAHEVALAVGLEKMTDAPPDEVTAALATASDQDTEAGLGFSFPAMAALLMRRYMHETGCSRDAFAPFAVNAHENAATSEFALFREPITPRDCADSADAATPLRVLDAAPICDGAAAVIVCSQQALRPHHKAVRVAASTVASDTLSLAARKDLLAFSAAGRSASQAFERSGLSPKDMNLFEAHDAFTIMTALSLEACGFARRGEGIKLAASGAIRRDGLIPLSTFGGLKARGHPVGASGAYQIVEATLQLRGEAGPNQIRGAKRALTQSVGGHGSVAFTHILEA
jgi:acetyl-CoA C-acetyltransferase